MVALAFSAALSAAAAPCAVNTCATFVVDIQIVSGVVRTVGAQNSKILHAELLPSPSLKENELKRILVADLDSALQSQPMLYWYALNKKDQKDNAFQKTVNRPPTDCLLASWKHGDWKEKFTSCYDKASDALKHNQHGFQILRVALSTLETQMIGYGALQPPQSKPPSDAQEGQLTFFIVAPKTKWSAALSDSPTVALRDDLVKYLDSFDQHIWRADYIKELIGDFYSRRGLAPLPLVDPAQGFSGDDLHIKIQPNLKITLVNLLPPAKDDLDRRLALYNLFSTRIYNEVRDIKPAHNTGKFDFDSVQVPLKLQPVNNQFAFSTAVPALSALGFTASEGPNTDGTGITVQVEKNAPKSATGAAAKVPVTVPPGKAAVPSASSNSPPRLSPLRPRSPQPRPSAEKTCSGQPDTTDSDCPADALPKDKKGFVGAGFSYVPGQGFHPILAFEYARLFGPGNLTFEGGSANQLVNGTASASFDYINFRNWNHRLTFDLNGGTDTAYHRLIGLQLADERRNGGKAHGQLEVIRDPLGSSLSFYVDGGAQTVSLTNPTATGAGGTFLTDTLASGDVGAVYSYSPLDSARPLQLRLEPVIRAGHASPGSFAKVSFTANYHQETLGPFVFEVKAQFQDASRLTPVYELPSFGGVASVRGFRADDLLARRLWTVQPEIWTAVPLPAAPGSSLSKFISQSMRLAVFCDAGGSYQTLSGPPGLKAGPGAGLRVLYRGATFRLDWAYGIGTVATGSGHGRVYFSVSTPII